MPHGIYIVFVFALGACVGSFLNVVVWRLPQVEFADDEGLLGDFFRILHALSDPPSHCPKCNELLKWYDNLPVVGWLALGGKCRFCKASISSRYPIVEALSGLMFVGYYVAFFIVGYAPCMDVTSGGQIIGFGPLNIGDYYWLYFIDMFMLSGLLAASLIDAEHFHIPLVIPWVIAAAGAVVHTIYDNWWTRGTVSAAALPGALAVGGTIGLIVSIVLLRRGILPLAFAEGGPKLEVDREKEQRARQAAAHAKRKPKKQHRDGSLPRQPRHGNQIQKKKLKKKQPEPKREAELPKQEDRVWTSKEVRREIRKEMLFLMPPLLLGLLFMVLPWKVEAVGRWWAGIAQMRWVAGLLGSVLGALVGGFVVWLTRILGSLVFGKVAMGMGDVDLMLGVGAVVGAGPVVAAFFLAPFFGIAIALYLWIMRKKRELPYGPFLSMGTAFVVLFYPQIAAHFAPGLSGLGMMVRDWLSSRMGA